MASWYTGVRQASLPPPFSYSNVPGSASLSCLFQLTSLFAVLSWPIGPILHGWLAAFFPTMHQSRSMALQYFSAQCLYPHFCHKQWFFLSSPVSSYHGTFSSGWNKRRGPPRTCLSHCCTKGAGVIYRETGLHICGTSHICVSLANPLCNCIIEKHSSWDWGSQYRAAAAGLSPPKDVPDSWPST